MPIKLLVHKSWHVYSAENIAKVKRDEAKARGEEEESDRRSMLADSEARLDRMRKKRKKDHDGKGEGEKALDRQLKGLGPPGADDEREVGGTVIIRPDKGKAKEAEAGPAAPLDPGKHINFWSEFEAGAVKTTSADHEAALQKVIEKEKMDEYTKMYLAKKGEGDMRGWYAREDLKTDREVKEGVEGNLERAYKDGEHKRLADPLALMNSFLKRRKDVLSGAPISRLPPPSSRDRYPIDVLSLIQAPDLPGFGFTVVPEERKYAYTFANFAKTVEAFVDALSLDKYAIYIFDYGAPTGLRLALSRPDSITAIISQNGNAFEEGLGDFWDTIAKYWDDPTQANRDSIRPLTTFEGTKTQYVTGESSPSTIPPETWWLDWTLLQRPGIVDIQLDIFYDYRTNVDLYPTFQKYLSERQPPLLAVWGKNDVIFVPAGAEKFKTVLKDAEVHLIDAGHFALENHHEEIIKLIRAFLAKKGI
ncbi:hypothetical protein RQP46_006985 [Phenoliferia psychrophenolica]